MCYNMKGKQLAEFLVNSDKRIKFQNREGWKNQTMAVNAILEQGDVYILIWTAHPHCIKEDLIEGQKLVWYNPNCHNAHLVKEYFPDYKN